MNGRIVTVRHGRPDMDRDVRITAKEYGEWWALYDLAGLAPGQEPPESLLEVAASCDVIICSTMPRAIETAAKLVEDGTRVVPRDALFIEAPLPAPPIPYLKLTPTEWGRVSRVMWFLGFAPNQMESHLSARRRVRKVAGRLIEYAERGEDVLLAAHGYLNWMIDSEFRRMGWKRELHVGNNDFWSYRAYRLPAHHRQDAKEAVSAE